MPLFSLITLLSGLWGCAETVENAPWEEEDSLCATWPGYILPEEAANDPDQTMVFHSGPITRSLYEACEESFGGVENMFLESIVKDTGTAELKFAYSGFIEVQTQAGTVTIEGDPNNEWYHLDASSSQFCLDPDRNISFLGAVDIPEALGISDVLADSLFDFGGRYLVFDLKESDQFKKSWAGANPDPELFTALEGDLYLADDPSFADEAEGTECMSGPMLRID